MPPPAEGLASRLFLGPALRTQPDRRLVTLVREGYETAFEEIVRRYGKPLGRYAASIVGGRSEDVLQDAFAKALPALRRDEAEIDLRPWLFRIVRNTALNELRDNPPSPEVLAEALAGGRNPAEELEQREQLADLMTRLRELPEAQRAAIVMRELEGLGHDEIATALGLTDGGARQAIYRARQALRDGAGLLLPLPLLRLLIDHGPDAAGAGAGGAIAAAGAGAGAGGAAKLGVVAVVLAGSVGAGVAVQDHRGDGRARAVEPPRAGAAAAPLLSPAPALASTDGGGSGPEPGDDRGGDRHGGNSGDGGHANRGPDGDGRHGGGPDLSGRGENGRGPAQREGGHRGEGPRGPGRGAHGDAPRDPGARHGGRSGPGGGGGPLREGRDGGGDDDDGGAGPGSRSGPGHDGGGSAPRPDGGPGGHSGPGGGSVPPPPPPPEEGDGGSGSDGSDGSGADSERSGSRAGDGS